MLCSACSCLCFSREAGVWPSSDSGAVGGPPATVVNTSGALAILSGMRYSTFRHKQDVGLIRIDCKYDGKNHYDREVTQRLADYRGQGLGGHVIVRRSLDGKIIDLVDGVVCAMMWGVGARQVLNRVVSGIGIASGEVHVGKYWVGKDLAESLV